MVIIDQSLLYLKMLFLNNSVNIDLSLLYLKLLFDRKKSGLGGGWGAPPIKTIHGQGIFGNIILIFLGHLGTATGCAKVFVQNCPTILTGGAKLNSDEFLRNSLEFFF